ncbi:hypothetical protein [Micromonospora sp. HK10]|uniref:hypothetical protein n=1 Tax=Micromonospora sp. HK10 TaxID=1538294 RepID=UPI000626EDAA|nr:hypothetical protein [Micromonospora sp. HK10]KKK06430.1 hypothetical protein LQ51_07715 [Micromonospora sp. HK10]
MTSDDRIERPAAGLYGQFRDVLYDADGEPRWDRGWVRNTIVTDFRRLLAGFVRGTPTTAESVLGLAVGAGLPAWDASGPPQPSPTQAALVDPHPHLVPRAQLQLDYIDPATGTISATPTGTLQLKALLGPAVPAWPDGNHATSTLREFGLVARLDGTQVLLNYRTHPAIAKDPASTLERTIWLVF